MEQTETGRRLLSLAKRAMATWLSVTLAVSPLGFWSPAAIAQDCSVPSTPVAAWSSDPASFNQEYGDESDDLSPDETAFYEQHMPASSDSELVQSVRTGDAGDPSSNWFRQVDPWGPRNTEWGPVRPALGAQLTEWFAVHPTQEYTVVAAMDLDWLNKRVIELDYEHAAVAALRWGRTYNSNTATLNAQVTIPMGAGWRSNWDKSVEMPNAGNVFLHRANGTKLSFWWNGTSQVWSDASYPPAGALTRLPSGQWQYVNTQDQVEIYSAAGRLLSQSDGGVVVTLQYDAASRLASVTDPFGRSLVVGYDGASRVSTVSLPGGTNLVYTYDAGHRLTSARMPDLSQRSFLYEDAGLPFHLTGVIDESGRRVLQVGYDSGGRPVASNKGSGVDPVTVSYAGNQATTTDVRGKQVVRTFATVGGSKRVTNLAVPATPDSPALQTSVSLDGSGNPVSTTLPTGEVSTAAYDTRGLPVSVTRAQGTSQQTTATMSWHPVWRKRTQIVASGVTTNTTLDAMGRVTQVSQTANGATRVLEQRVYNAQNLLHSKTDARGSTWTYGYDGAGRRTTVTDPQGRISTASNFNAMGLPQRITRPNGLVVDLTYDTRGRPTARTVAGRVTAIQYDAAGRVTRQTRPDGSWSSRSYTTAGLLAAIGNHRSETTMLSRDGAGAVVGEHTYSAGGALVRTSTRQLDTLGRVKAVVDSRNHATQMLYGADGRPRGITNPAGQSFTRTPDLLGRVIARTQPNTTAMRNLGGPATTTSTSAFDGLNRHTSTTDHNGVATGYGHDHFNRVVSEVGNDPGAQTVARNNADDITSHTNAVGGLNARAHDAMGRLTSIGAGTWLAQTYTYVPHRAEPLLSQVTDSTGSTSWTYDSAGRMLTKTQVTNGVSRTLTVTRDSLGRPSRMTYPSGMYVDMAYSNGTVASLAINGSTLLNTIAYRPFTQTASSWRWSNNSTYTRGFDNDGRVTSVTLGPATRTYSYDAVGRVASHAEGAVTSTYGYDELGQVTSYTGPAGNRSWTWDGNGNRRTENVSGSTRTYAYAPNSNRLTSVTGQRSYTYDAGGSPTNEAVSGYASWYDNHRRLIRMQQLGAMMNRSLSFSYNALGQRVNKVVRYYIPEWGGGALRAPGSNVRAAPKTVSAQSLAAQSVSATSSTWVDDSTWTVESNRLFFHDEQGRLLGEYDSVWPGDNQEHVWFNGQPVAVVRGGIVYHVHADHLGTPRSITRGSTGAQVWRWDSEPFGSTYPTTFTGGFDYHLRFAGQYFDLWTGLHYNWHRYYDPVTGRYTQADPIGLGGGLARYTYAHGTPVNAIDPTGLETTLVTVYDTVLGMTVGTHTAMHIRRDGKDFLYDPGGGYNPRDGNGAPYRGSGGYLEGPAASLDSFVRHHTSMGSTVRLVTLPTTASQEKAIQQRAEELGDTGPFTCASSVAGALGGVCGIVQSAILPSTLYNSAKGARCGP